MHGMFRNHDIIEMDVSNMAQGVYIVKIQTSKEVESKKLVIQ